jgi:hypothetical protein
MLLAEAAGREEFLPDLTFRVFLGTVFGRRIGALEFFQVGLRIEILSEHGVRLYRSTGRVENRLIVR